MGSQRDHRSADIANARLEFDNGVVANVTAQGLTQPVSPDPGICPGSIPKFNFTDQQIDEVRTAARRVDISRFRWRES
jgi:hypothetical protein